MMSSDFASVQCSVKSEKSMTGANIVRLSNASRDLTLPPRESTRSR